MVQALIAVRWKTEISTIVVTTEINKCLEKQDLDSAFSFEIEDHVVEERSAKNIDQGTRKILS